LGEPLLERHATLMMERLRSSPMLMIRDRAANDRVGRSTRKELGPRDRLIPGRDAGAGRTLGPDAHQRAPSRTGMLRVDHPFCETVVSDCGRLRHPSRRSERHPRLLEAWPERELIDLPSPG
jgi:hypothetical protein